METRKLPVRRLAVASGVLALGLGVGDGAYSLFQTSTSPTVQPLTAGTVTLALGGSGSSNSLSIGAKGLLAGSSVSREVVLDNTGTVGFASVSVAVAASPSNALTTDSTDGLQVQVLSCSAAWTSTSLSGPPGIGVGRFRDLSPGAVRVGGRVRWVRA